MLSDVIVHHSAGSEVVAIARQAGVIGDLVNVQIAGEGTGAEFPARVIESRPVMVDGAVRHRLLLLREPR